MVGSAGDIEGRIDSIVGSVTMEEFGIMVPLARDREECCVCQVL